MLLYIVRHGCTDMNGSGLRQGTTDTPLNDVGRAQAHKLADHLRLVPFREAWSSDLKGASETAQIVLASHPKVALKLDPRLRERGLATSTGTPYDQPVSSDAETEEESDARLTAWLVSLITAHTPIGSPAGTPRTPTTPTDPGAGAVLAVTHWFCLRSLLRIFRAGPGGRNPPSGPNAPAVGSAATLAVGTAASPTLPSPLVLPDIHVAEPMGTLESRAVENTAVAIVRVWWEEGSAFGEPMVPRGRLEAWASADHLDDVDEAEEREESEDDVGDEDD